AATTGKSWGNVAFRFSASGGQGNSGQAFNIDTEHSVFGQSGSGSPNLRLGYEKKHGFTASPWLENRNTTTTQRLYYDYSFYLNDNVDFNTSGSVLLNVDNQQTNDFTAKVNWRGQGLNISAGYSYGITNDIVDTDQQRYFLNFSWSLYDRSDNSRQRVRYNSRTQIVGASYNKVNSNYLGDYGYQLLAERGADHRREQVRASYTHSLFRTDFNADNTNRETQHARSNASINLSTSIGMADGKVGIGTNITTPFALIAKHKTLDDVDVLINVNRRDRAQGLSGNHFAALINLGSGYSTAQFTVDVPDAPFGYDWGPGTYRVAGGANTGHTFVVGSALSYTLLGVLTNDKGEPISLKRGKVIQQGEGLEDNYIKAFFTNRAGRFVIEGVGYGEFTVQLDGVEGHFTIPESEQRFVDVGTIMLLKTPVTTQKPTTAKGDKP
ncbi:MAG: pilus assembly protein PapC, partial [Algicola sp.]|nr:pilus assembly protein PapC [Algicola sp.]